MQRKDVSSVQVTDMVEHLQPTREAWLRDAVDTLRCDFDLIGFPLPQKIRVSCGWPSHSALTRSGQAIGQAWSPRCSSDGTHETFLSPVLDDPVEVLAVLVHELVHHAVGTEHGHKGLFRVCALASGLEGKMTATVAGESLRVRLNALAKKLGPYSHGALRGTPQLKKQGTRMIKVICASCGCIVRMTRHWLDLAGPPTCGCNTSMQESTPERKATSA